MNFADIRFWGILAVSLAAILIIRVVVVKVIRPDPGVYDRVALAVMGLVLLGCVILLSLGIFAAVCVTTYLGLRLILKADSSPKRRGKWLWLLIPLQLSPLLFYKYGGFLGNEILGLGSRAGSRRNECLPGNVLLAEVLYNLVQNGLAAASG